MFISVILGNAYISWHYWCHAFLYDFSDPGQCVHFCMISVILGNTYMSWHSLLKPCIFVWFQWSWAMCTCRDTVEAMQFCMISVILGNAYMSWHYLSHALLYDFSDPGQCIHVVILCMISVILGNAYMSLFFALGQNPKNLKSSMSAYSQAVSYGSIVTSCQWYKLQHFLISVYEKSIVFCIKHNEKWYFLLFQFHI